MRALPLILLFSSVGSITPALTLAPAPAARLEFFESRIRPLLATECYGCHSASAVKIKGGLALDTRAAVLKGGDSNQPGLIPGDPDASLLIKAVKYTDPDLQMPPKKRLSPEQIADLITWVKMGAPDPRDGPAPLTRVAPVPKHWAFQPITDPAVPDIAGSTPIDRFLNEKLAEAHLAPAAKAGKLTLIRRATYDLTGLPPTPQEIEAFVTDPSDSAFVKVVDRLLASKGYGEKWGRKWLDLARYADTAGESADFPIPQAYLYRNYVIDSFNADLPYDEFLKEQIAGDLLPAKDEKDRERKIIATGFLATAKRFGVDPENQMHLTIDDVIDTLGKSTLALSLNCCRCHDHKFDPISSKDYYSLYGIFASTRFPFPGAETHKYQMDFVPLAPPAKAEAMLAAYHAKLDPVKAEANRLQHVWESTRGSPQEGANYDRWQSAMARVKQITAAGPGFEMAYAVAEGPEPHEVHVMKRGEPRNAGDLAPRGFLAILGGQKLPATEKGSGRLELANWIASTDNPLTARVMVNRLWQGHFGHGLVRTPSDFGTRGSPPTHPQLLDYLARRFIDSGWSIKTLQRAILLTDAYQRSSAIDPTAQEKDANNDLLSHFDRRRLEAEEIRDSILFVAGNLDPTPGGEHPFPSPDKWDFTQHDAFKGAYETTKRSVYVMQQRIRRLPFFATFDGPDPNATTAERTASTTPLQALYMMNDAFVHNESVVFAKSLVGGVRGEEAQIRRATELVYGRPANDDEVQAAVEYEHAYGAKLSASVHEKPVEALAAYARVLFCSNEFFYVD